jgi:hypothetical protein
VACHEDTCRVQESRAGPDGHFFIDFSSEVDWEYDDHVRVGQFVTANGLVEVVAGSPEFTLITPTATPTPTLMPTVTPTATPSQDIPPIIDITAPIDACVGEQIILDGSATRDVDGDPIQFQWTQYHNPDRYEGTEYVTGNDATIESLDGTVRRIYPESLTGVSQIRFTPGWPGTYRFELVATDKDGRSRETVDVVVNPAGHLFPVRGMAVDGGSREHWSESEVEQLLAYLEDLGFNYIQVGFHDTMESPTSNEVLIDQCYLPWTLTLAQNEAMIDLAHEAGMGVMISPHMGCLIDGTWYEFGNISPSDPVAWFESYIDYAVFYAQLAQQHEVEILNLGGDMRQFHWLADGWRRLLEEVRAVYGGRVAFSWLNFRPAPGQTIFPHLDGVDVFVNGFGPNGSGSSQTHPRTGHNHPSVSEMIYWFDLELASYFDLLQQQYGKPTLATDLYTWPLDGMNILTGAAYFTDFRPPRDSQEPIDYAEAAFRVMASRNWEGVFFWSLSVDPPDVPGPDIRAQPAMLDMIKTWFSPWTGPTPPPTATETQNSAKNRYP